MKKRHLLRHGRPDVHSAGLAVLKDVVDGVVCWWSVPPPDWTVLAALHGEGEERGGDGSQHASLDRTALLGTASCVEEAVNGVEALPNAEGTVEEHWALGADGCDAGADPGLLHLEEGAESDSDSGEEV